MGQVRLYLQRLRTGSLGHHVGRCKSELDWVDIGIAYGAYDYCNFKARTDVYNKIYRKNIHDSFGLFFCFHLMRPTTKIHR